MSNITLHETAIGSTLALILPGIGDSDPDHWQSLWQAKCYFFKRVQQRDWDHPIREEWTETLEKQVAKSGDDVVLVAHSLGCLLVAHWAAQTKLKIKGALLVAPPNPAASVFPKEAVGFSPLPTTAFNFPSIVVASANDTYGDLAFTKACASAWGCRFVNIGNMGHINTKSGIGEWLDGLALFQQLAQ